MPTFSGLTTNEAETRLRQYGLNELRDVAFKSPFAILLRQIKNNFIVYLLLAAMLISFFVGKTVTAYTILAVIFMVVIAGFIQEYRAEKAIKALRSMLMPATIVRRNGKEQEIASTHLVPEDIIILRTGEKIPADCAIIEAKDLLVNESVLTGESREIPKQAQKKPHTLKDEHLLAMGTFIVNGRCTARILHTGMNTKFGKISQMISTAEKELPLQKKINTIAKYMAVLALVISVLTGILMLARAPALSTVLFIDVLILVIALSVSAFPEGLPVVLITALASGAHRMAKKNAIVNRMSIIETLGETTVICSDKTGTLTKGEMTVKKLFVNNQLIDASGTGYDATGIFSYHNVPITPAHSPALRALLETAVLCNDARIERSGEDNSYHIIGSPTEAALLIAAAKANIHRDDLRCARLEERPFNSERKMMSVLCKTPQGKTVYAKGAPEFLLRTCTTIKKGDKTVRLTERERKAILTVTTRLTTATLRTIALATKTTTTHHQDHFEENLTFLGLVGIEDPPREEVPDAIRTCTQAGITVKMITGDNKETARAIAHQIGLTGAAREGAELDQYTDEELRTIIPATTIFARVKPEHKLRIVKALKSNGEIVTMTGDGVNDAPALKEAHIGVAMGKTGTDVARSVADLTLKDDNFATIVDAIKEGRTIFKNIRKFVTYQLSCNYAELTILFLGVLLAPLIGWPVPLLLALQILFMNLVTDNLPAITLGFNKTSEDVMNEKPRTKATILNSRLIGILFFTGTLLALLVLGIYYFEFSILGKSAEHARTTALASLILLEIASAFNFRSFRKGTLTRSPLTNPYLFIASTISLLVTLLIIYAPINTLFETVPLGLDEWIIPILAALFLIILYDALKWINTKYNLIDFEHL